MRFFMLLSVPVLHVQFLPSHNCTALLSVPRSTCLELATCISHDMQLTRFNWCA